MGERASMIAGLLVIAACTHPYRPGGEQGDGDGPDGPSPPTGTCADGIPADEVVDDSDPGNPKTSCSDVAYCDAWSPGYTPDPAVQSTVSRLVGSMSLSEKAEQMRGTNPGGGSNY